mgnify:CR=1 FL=1
MRLGYRPVTIDGVVYFKPDKGKKCWQCNEKIFIATDQQGNKKPISQDKKGEWGIHYFQKPECRQPREQLSKNRIYSAERIEQNNGLNEL